MSAGHAAAGCDSGAATGPTPGRLAATPTGIQPCPDTTAPSWAPHQQTTTASPVASTGDERDLRETSASPDRARRSEPCSPPGAGDHRAVMRASVSQNHRSAAPITCATTAVRSPTFHSARPLTSRGSSCGFRFGEFEQLGRVVDLVA